MMTEGMESSMNNIRFFQKIIRFEFWPFYIFYIPMLPVWLFFSFLSGSLIYFIRANPTIPFGGFFDYSKYTVLQKIKDKYKVRSYYFDQKPDNINFFQEYFNFPFICKPDMGERGKNVELIKNMEHWERIYPTLSYPFIIEEYSDYPVELGILYYRFPDGKSGITSIVGKDFLSITGNGTQTVEQLFQKHLRSNRYDYFKTKFKDQWSKVLPKGEELILEEIGNHCRGTTFYDYNHLINDKLVNVFDTITASFPDFHYGRFDLKVRSIQDLYEGKHIKVFELNGVNSEANHIYDPNYNIFKAYAHVVKNLYLVYQISRALKKQNVPLQNTLSEFMKALKKHLMPK